MGHRGHNKKNNTFWTIVLVLIAISYWYITVPIALLIVYIWKRDAIHRFMLSNDIKRLEELNYDIRSGFQSYQSLLREDGESSAIYQLRKRMLEELVELDKLFQKTKKYLEPVKSQEAMDVLHLKYQLQSVEEARVVQPQSEPARTVFTEQERIAQLAPEILETYCNVQKDNLVVREKLEETRDKREELTALHEANMQRFEDILEGYLKIKASPKDYFNGKERMDQAKEAMEKFDSDLDDTIRQFNEADMRDFEISLRMMKKEVE